MQGMMNQMQGMMQMCQNMMQQMGSMMGNPMQMQQPPEKNKLSTYSAESIRGKL